MDLTLSNGNLTYTRGSTDWEAVLGTQSMTAGNNWYFEVFFDTAQSSGNGAILVNRGKGSNISSSYDDKNVSLVINEGGGKKNPGIFSSGIIDLSPNRVIFNPGAENPKLYNLFLSKGIKCENSCTLVLLSTKQY